jgi:hypothetical protein
MRRRSGHARRSGCRRGDSDSRAQRVDPGPTTCGITTLDCGHVAVAVFARKHDGFRWNIADMLRLPEPQRHPPAGRGDASHTGTAHRRVAWRYVSGRASQPSSIWLAGTTTCGRGSHAGGRRVLVRRCASLSGTLIRLASSLAADSDAGHEPGADRRTRLS